MPKKQTAPSLRLFTVGARQAKADGSFNIFTFVSLPRRTLEEKTATAIQAGQPAESIVHMAEVNWQAVAYYNLPPLSRSGQTFSQFLEIVTPAGEVVGTFRSSFTITAHDIRERLIRVCAGEDDIFPVGEMGNYLLRLRLDGALLTEWPVYVDHTEMGKGAVYQ